MSESAIGGEPDNLPTEHEVILPPEPVDDTLPEVEAVPAVVPVKRGHPLLAWLVIGAFVIVVPFLRQLKTPEEQRGNQGERVSLLVLTMQSKFFVGYNEFLSSADPNASKLLADQAVA